MAASNTKVPSKETVDFLYKGLAFFYPRTIFGEEKAKSLGYLKTWSGMESSDFALFATNITGTEDVDEAARIVLRWKNSYDKGEYPNATIPENLDELVVSLEEVGEQKGNQAEKTRLAKQVLLQSEIAKEKEQVQTTKDSALSSETTPLKQAATEDLKEQVVQKITAQEGSPTPIAPESLPSDSPASPPLALEVIKKVNLNPVGKLVLSFSRLPFYFAGPSLAEESPQGQRVATAQNLLFKQGITSSSFKNFIKPKALSLGVNQSQIDRLIQEISRQEKAFPSFFSRVTAAYDIREIAVNTGFPQASADKLFLQSSPEAGSYVLPKSSFFGGFFGRMGQQLFGGFAKKAVKKSLTKVATKIGVVAGEAGGPVGVVIGYVSGWVVDQVTDKIVPLIKKFAKVIAGASIAAAGLLIGGTGGLIMTGAGAAVAIGPKNLQSALASIGSGIKFLITSLVVPSLATPLIASLIGIPLLVALIVLIINSGAYITPPSPSSVPGAIESPYIGIEKEAEPNQLDRISGSQSITYRVRIFAKKGTLSNIRIQNEYKVISNSSPAVPSPAVDGISNPPEIISPVEDYVFEYQISLDESYNDSIVVDSITVTADAPEQSDATARISASVVIGNPPISCPLPGASVDPFHGSYTPGVETGGHGSANYWQRMGGSACRYSLPQGVPQCRYTNDPRARDAGNPCYNASGCSSYGYSIDVFGSPGQEVFLPTVDGKNVQWSYVRSFSNGTAGNSHIYRAGQYTIVLTHLSSNTNTGSGLSSGTAISKLHPMGTNTHVHIEFADGGRYVRPEEYFCF